MKVTDFGTTPYGDKASLYTVSDGKFSFSVSDYGATLVNLFVPDKNGKPVDVILGYKSAKQTNMIPRFCGATVGRFANRIENARYSANGREYLLEANDGTSTLHGGKRGFSSRMFSAKEIKNGIKLSRRSPDGEDGFGGNLDISVSFTLKDGALHIRYEAVCDKDTPLNLTNHAYFNLYGCDSERLIDDLTVSINAECYCGSSGTPLPDGSIKPVRGTPMDLRKPVRIGDGIHSDFRDIRKFGGYDHAYIITKKTDGIEHAADVYCAENGIYMECLTDMPAVQLYTRKPTKNAYMKYAPKKFYSALCLETEYCPNCLNYGYYPGDLQKAGEVFKSETIYIFTVK